jgi:hypothetical protein
VSCNGSRQSPVILRPFHEFPQVREWYRFSRQYVDTILLDDAGHIVVSHRFEWFEGSTDQDDWRQRLTLLDELSLGLQGEAIVDDWALLQRAIAGRALVTVPGGILVVNTEEASNPLAEAFFPTSWWAQLVTVHRRSLVVPSGPYGIAQLDLDAFNLVSTL